MILPKVAARISIASWTFCMIPHPRAYGNFARLLGKYVRDEHVIALEEAIRKLSGQKREC